MNEQGWFSHDTFAVNVDLSTPMESVLKKLKFMFYATTDSSVADYIQFNIDDYMVSNYKIPLG